MGIKGRTIASQFIAVISLALVITGPASSADNPRIRLGIESELLLHLPLFVAEDENFFSDEKILVQRETKFGKFRTSTSLINKETDIILQATEAYFELADAYGPDSYKIVGGLTATAGSVVVAKEPIPKSGFSWTHLRQKRFLGRDKNSVPMYFLRSVLVTNGVDPANVKFRTTAPVPARVNIWSKKQSYDYAIFFEPDASKIIREGKGYFATMLGPAVGKIDSNVFIVRSEFLKSQHNRELLQRFMNAIQKALNSMSGAPIKSLSINASRRSKDSTLGSSRAVIRKDLTNAIKRYRSIGLWKKNLYVAPRAVTEIQRMIIDGGGTKTKKHHCFKDIVDMQFAIAADANFPSGVSNDANTHKGNSVGCR